MGYFGLLILALLAATGCTGTLSGEVKVQPWYPAINGNGDSLQNVYESRVPCLDAEAKARPACQRVKLALAIYNDVKTGAPNSYQMSRVYVGDGLGDVRLLNSGSLLLGKGAAFDSEAIVYRLDANAPADFRVFWQVSSDIVFVLDAEEQPRLGDTGYGYALNLVFPIRSESGQNDYGESRSDRK